MKKFRKRLAEMIWELGFIIMPKGKDNTYLEDTFTGMNCKYEKIKVNNLSDSTEIEEKIEPWKR